jgi:hypothetical protein
MQHGEMLPSKGQADLTNMERWLLATLAASTSSQSSAEQPDPSNFPTASGALDDMIECLAICGDNAVHTTEGAHEPSDVCTFKAPPSSLVD